MLGYFPENGTAWLFPALALGVFSFYASIAILNISVMSALADVADEHELATGRRQEGIFYSARTFFSKLTSGLGHLLAGIAIDVIGYPARRQGRRGRSRRAVEAGPRRWSHRLRPGRDRHFLLRALSHQQDTAS